MKRTLSIIILTLALSLNTYAKPNLFKKIISACWRYPVGAGLKTIQFLFVDKNKYEK